MKKWLIRFFAGLILLLIAVFGVLFIIGKTDESMADTYTKNENLPTVKSGWKGTPVDKNGRFVNAEFPFLPKVTDLLKWQLSANPFKEAKKNDSERLRVFEPDEFFNSGENGILWLGQASFYIRLNGKTILIDPVFGNPSFLKRFVEVPNPIGKIIQLDYILITHDHRDHCDENTLKELAEKFPNAKIFAGLEMRDLFEDWGIAGSKIQTAGWYQQFETSGELKITFVPTRHWSRRGLFDTNKRLWGGYVIESGDVKIYHGGDSGYGSHYKDLAETFGTIDYFIIGIGAFEPRWFMQPNHNNPEDAFQAFQDAGAKTIIPMHYGTFDLSDEPPGESLRRLKSIAENAGQIEKLKSLQIFESLKF